MDWMDEGMKEWRNEGMNVSKYIVYRNEFENVYSISNYILDIH